MRKGHYQGNFRKSLNKGMSNIVQEKIIEGMHDGSIAPQGGGALGNEREINAVANLLMSKNKKALLKQQKEEALLTNINQWVEIDDLNLNADPNLPFQNA